MTVPVNRTTIATMIKSFAENELVNMMAIIIRHLQDANDAKVRVLEAKIADLEGRAAKFKYVGPWRSDGSYLQGNFVTYDGNLWHCNADTTARPGTGPEFTLCVRKGRDLRDDSQPRRPTASRRQSS